MNFEGSEIHRLIDILDMLLVLGSVLNDVHARQLVQAQSCAGFGTCGWSCCGFSQRSRALEVPPTCPGSPCQVTAAMGQAHLDPAVSALALSHSRLGSGLISKHNHVYTVYELCFRHAFMISYDVIFGALVGV